MIVSLYEPPQIQSANLLPISRSDLGEVGSIRKKGKVGSVSQFGVVCRRSKIFEALGMSEGRVQKVSWITYSSYSESVKLSICGREEEGENECGAHLEKSVGR